MKQNEIIQKIENFAPPQTQENWDCSGWIVQDSKVSVNKVMLCLSVTKKILKQAKENNCDMLISHHPMYFVPFDFQGFPIYCAHTNLDKAVGGTTDTLIKSLGFTQKINAKDEFLRFIDVDMTLAQLIEFLKTKISGFKVVNNFNEEKIKRIAFCAGSGSEYISLASQIQADMLVTGDVKYHSAHESEIVIIDIGHFKSEYPVLKTLKSLLETNDLEVIIADEKSPFKYY